MKPAQCKSPRPELWGGIECTVNRVDDRYHDQIERSGHANRIDDLDLIAELGIRAIRYPVLWERQSPDGCLDGMDWSWAEQRLQRLRNLGIRPIVGLVHHGSGPRHTSLTSPCFAEGLGAYAARVAERFPWVEEWTPVNEPMTTARFSGLYGHWYPHGRDEHQFARALVNQCMGVAMAMQAVRRVNPNAQLVQTDDLGKVYATPHMQYQADFENERRWLSWDMLCGLVDRTHMMWPHLLCAGIAEADLGWFLDNPCPPDVIGVNHYLTSERFIDERLARYPANTHGGNGRDRYADVEAVRVLPDGLAGIGGVLREAWSRYGRPIAITEVHLGCTREEQVRWLVEAWDAAVEAHRDGADIRAVTAWALLGSYDWNSLLTRFDGHYEPGVFDIRGGTPRPTALATVLRQIGGGEAPDHPVLSTPGWWRHPHRLLYPSDARRAADAPHISVVERSERAAEERPILITGAGGSLASEFAHLCGQRYLPFVALGHDELDIADPGSIEAALSRHRPWAIINAAGYADVDGAEADQDRCLRDNASGPAVLAAACARDGVRLITISSDLVFDGRKSSPYLESDTPAPLGVYGRSKAQAERAVLEVCQDALAVRCGMLFSAGDGCSFAAAALKSVADGGLFLAPDDIVCSPTFAPDLVHACLDLLVDGERGIWHLANQGALSWRQFAELLVDRAGLDVSAVRGCSARSLGLSAPRPRFSALASERGQLLRPIEQAVDRYIQDLPVRPAIVAKIQHARRPDTARAGDEPLRTLRERGGPVRRHPLKRR